MINPRHKWNVQYIARSNRSHLRTSRNTSPATKKFASSQTKRPVQCAETGVTLQHHQILHLPLKMILQNIKEICRKRLKRHLYNAGPIRAWSENDPTMNPSARNPPRNWGYFSRSPRTFQISSNIAPATKSDSWTAPNIAPATNAKCATWMQLRQILCLPLKVTGELN